MRTYAARLACLAPFVLGCGGPDTRETATTHATATESCSEADATDEERSSTLWARLGEWAFADEQIDMPTADEMTAAEAERYLDDAAVHVPGLDTPAAWRSAARYFEAENFHGLEGPACRRASR